MPDNELDLARARAKAKLKLQEQTDVPERGVMSTVGHAALDALATPGALVRTGLGALTGNYKEGDLSKSFSGEGPSTADLMERAGVGNASLSDALPGMYSESGNEWLKFKKGGPLDPTARGTAGFVGDVALDPLTYLSGGLSAAAKAGKGGELLNKLQLLDKTGALNTAGKTANVVLNPLELISRKGGGAVYNSAFDKADRKVMTDAGVGSIADILKENRFTGSAQDALEKIKELHTNTGENLNKMRKGAEGITGSLQEYMSPQFSSNIEDITKKLRVSPEAAHQAEAQTIEELISSYANKGQLTPQELSDLKRLANPKVSAISKAIRPVSKDQEDIARALLAGELNKTENQVMHSALGDQGIEKYLKAKRDYGTTGHSVQKELDKQAAREMSLTGAGISSLDPVLAAAGGPVAIALKKAKDIAKLTGTKTRVGLGLEDFGNASSGISDAVLRQLLEKKFSKKGDQ